MAGRAATAAHKTSLNVVSDESTAAESSSLAPSEPDEAQLNVRAADVRTVAMMFLVDTTPIVCPPKDSNRTLCSHSRVDHSGIKAGEMQTSMKSGVLDF